MGNGGKSGAWVLLGKWAGAMVGVKVSSAISDKIMARRTLALAVVHVLPQQTFSSYLYLAMAVKKIIRGRPGSSSKRIRIPGSSRDEFGRPVKPSQRIFGVKGIVERQNFNRLNRNARLAGVFSVLRAPLPPHRLTQNY